MSDVIAPEKPPGALAPLKISIFRWLWIAGVVSNIGSWMQTVGAQWFLVEQHSSPAVIALVSTAAAAPVLLLGIPAGVLGEFMNRRSLLIGVQAAQAMIALALVFFTAVGVMTPPLLLTLTFALGAASAVQLPAYQAIVPEIVPTRLIANAASLSSIGVNVARAIGPALAGVVIAQLGIPFVFALNAASFGVFLVVLIAWRGYTPPETKHEAFLDATRAGLRYVRHAGVVRRLYLQLLLFIIPANALWALLPVLANEQLGLDANGYGVLLAALGIGSIGGAFLIPAARAKIGVNRTIMISSAVYGLGITVVALSRSLAVALPVLVIVGVAWIGVIATLNGTVQAFLPVWVRTRGLSIYQLVLFGGTAVGAALVGVVGTVAGTPLTMATAGVLVLIIAAAQLLWPLSPTADKSRAIVRIPLTDVPPFDVSQPDDLVAESEPVITNPTASTLVLVRYEVPTANRARFLDLMRDVEKSRRRTGARSWELYEDREQPGYLVEAFSVGSWQEHLGQHDGRTTGYDAEVIDAARQLASSAPIIEHLIASR